MSPAGWKPPASAVTPALCRLSGSPREQNAIPAVPPPPPLAHTLLVLLRSARLVPHLLRPPGSSRAPSGRRCPAHARCQLGAASPSGAAQQLRRGAASSSQLLAAEPRCGPRRGGCGAASSLIPAPLPAGLGTERAGQRRGTPSGGHGSCTAPAGPRGRAAPLEPRAPRGSDAPAPP